MGSTHCAAFCDVARLHTTPARVCDALAYRARHVDCIAVQSASLASLRDSTGWAAYMDSRCCRDAVLKEFSDWQRAATIAAALDSMFAFPQCALTLMRGSHVHTRRCLQCC